MLEIQSVDPFVSRTKFERELKQYRILECHYRNKGWFLLEAEFPRICVAFVVAKLRPPPLVATVELNFTNYDLHPPSVRFVDPFSREYVKAKDLHFKMMRRLSAADVATGTTVPAQQQQFQLTNLIQHHDPEEIPFLCLPGVREYHNHPAHSGDAWLLHRGSGEGSLHFILDQIWKYGVSPLQEFQVQVQVQTPILGLRAPIQAIPE